MPDDTPAKLGMAWAVAMDKPWFVGKKALERMVELPIGRRQVGLEFVGGPNATADLRGEPLVVGDRMVGRVTSAERSPVLDRAIGLGWVRVEGDTIPGRLTTGSGVSVRVVTRPFYDPEGGRMRG
jgi:sarcosine oxidase subunit alpha